MSIRKQARFPAFGGAIAAPPRAWGATFDLIVANAELGCAAPFYLSGGRAVVDICGPLVQRIDYCFDSYESILSRVAAAMASQASEVVLRIDSPGGDFSGMLEAASELRRLASVAGKPLTAFTSGACLSAAYALATGCSRIVCTASAFVGSVGVWSALVDVTAADRAAGQTIAIIASGTRKADRNPHTPMTEDAMVALQSEVDQMGSMFFAAVSSARSLPPARLEALQGAQVLGAAAIAAGLIDEVVPSWESYLGGKTRSLASAENTKGQKAMNFKEALAALAKAADEGDEEDKARYARMKAAAEEEPKKEAEAEEKEKPAASAKSEFPPEKEKEKEGESKAMTLAMSLAREVQELKAAASAKVDSDARAALLATRPDFSTEVRASLEGAPLAMVKDAVKKWPRVIGPAAVASGAATPGATRGESQKSSPEGAAGISTEDNDYIMSRMGGTPKGMGVVHTRGGHTMTLGPMSPEEAAKALAEITKKGAV